MNAPRTNSLATVPNVPVKPWPTRAGQINGPYRPQTSTGQAAQR